MNSPVQKYERVYEVYGSNPPEDPDSKEWRLKNRQNFKIHIVAQTCTEAWDLAREAYPLSEIHNFQYVGDRVVIRAQQ